MRRSRSRGFTLLEVAVAVAIVSIGLIAAFNGIVQMAHSTVMLRDRAFADWIAMNVISSIRISGDFPDVGSFDGSTEFAGREWRWEAQVAETGVTDLRRIDMRVALEDLPDETVSIITGFVARPGSGAVTRIDWWGSGMPGQTPDPDGEPEVPPPPGEDSEDDD
jgi:general secretion pathway protein I